MDPEDGTVDGSLATPADGRVDEVILGEVVELMAQGGGNGLVTAYRMFLTGIPARLAGIDAAVAEGRFTDAAREAHTLRGSAGSFGARRLAALTHAVEQRCREQDAAGAARVVDEMGEEFRFFRAVLARRVTRLAG